MCIICDRHYIEMLNVANAEEWLEASVKDRSGKPAMRHLYGVQKRGAALKRRA